MFTCVLWRYVASTVILVPKLQALVVGRCRKALLGVWLVPEPLEGADRVGGQLRGDKECPFSGVTKSGRVWRRVPESDAGSLSLLFSSFSAFALSCCYIETTYGSVLARGRG